MDRAYEGNETRQLVLELNMIPVVPPKSNRLDPWEYDRELYKKRNEVERLFRRLKGFRRIFSRFEKLDVVFLAFIYFAFIVEGSAVGGIGLVLKDDVFRRSAEIGYWLGEGYWGRGIATEAVRALTEYAFVTFDLCRLHAGVFEWNPASMRVLEKAGYTLEARHRKNVTKDGETIDRLVYALVRPSD